MPSLSPSPSRGRPRTRSPYSDERPESRSRSASRPRRTISPRSPSRTPRRNGRYRISAVVDLQAQSEAQRQNIRSLHDPVVIEKLTKNVTEAHLREIFGSYGQIRDLDMPMNRQSNISVMTNRGTAYILYATETDALGAIAHMHESQLDGCSINVSIVLPRRKFSPSPPLARNAPVSDRGPPLASFRGPPPPRRRSPQPSYNPGHVLAHALRAVIAHGRDRFLHGPGRDRLQDDVEVVDGTALGGMVDGDAEAQVIAATAVMTIEAGADLVDGVEEADVKTILGYRKGNKCIICKDGVWDGGQMVAIKPKDTMQ
ncbi:Serine arginine-rich splicing factor SR45 [Hyphodiscus hymeniophilus]|uniref:Serine arginine-rich splicing factor SR45 n=1 Tax=Hyphodiscus hymeniophilus TaxID=353542 RepID=A0A9P6VDR3_9HELO|nr:Serine arginine-rich splicing factor SR45 [Hyphodiscus hymeniophilus]